MVIHVPRLGMFRVEEQLGLYQSWTGVWKPTVYALAHFGLSPIRSWKVGWR